MGAKYSSLGSSTRASDLNNGDLVMIRNTRYPQWAVQRAYAELNGLMWNSVGVVLTLPEFEDRMYLLEISPKFPHDELCSLLSGAPQAAGIRIVPLAERLGGLGQAQTCAIRKLDSNVRNIESLRVQHHFAALKAFNEQLRPNIDTAMDQAEVVTWTLNTLGIVPNEKCKLTLSNLRGDYLNKHVKQNLQYAATVVHSIAK